MKKRIQYRQCKLRKQTAAGQWTESVAYIPAEYAQVGKVVRIRKDDNTEASRWSDGWEVVTAGANIWSDELPDSHSAIKSHRKSTGDTLPRNK